MKRVFFFRPSMSYGGADRVTLTLLQNLDRTRIEPTLVLVRAEGPLLDDVPAWVRVISLDARLALAAGPLYRVLRREEPDVLFSTSSASNVVASGAHAAARSRARLVLSERNALFRGRRGDLKQNVEVALKRVSYRRANVVTAVSQGVADQLIAALRIPTDRVEVVYNPMVEDRLLELTAEPVDHPWFHAPEPVILAVGRLVVQKDYPTLLDAFVRVRRRVPARLFVLGEGPLKQELIALAREKGLEDSVEFAGFHKNPFKFMARARILMHASRAEGLPGSLIQTMACGTPVVSTDCDYGPREVVARPGSDGHLVPVGDAAALAEQALQLLEDPRRRDAMAVEARRSAQRFTVAASMQRYERAIVGEV